MAPINGNINSDVQLMDLKNDDPNHYLLRWYVLPPMKQASSQHYVPNTE